MGSSVSKPVITAVMMVPKLCIAGTHMWKGETDKAKEALLDSLEFIDHIPVAGHVKSCVHQAYNQTERANAAMERATRTLFTMGAGAAAVALGATGVGVGAAGVLVGQALSLRDEGSRIRNLGSAEGFLGRAKEVGALCLEMAGDAIGATSGAEFYRKFGAAQGLTGNKPNTKLTPDCDNNPGSAVDKSAKTFSNQSAGTFSKVRDQMKPTEGLKLNYGKAMSNGIGVNNVVTSEFIHMEKGTNIQQAINEGLISLKSVKKQLAELAARCDSAGFAPTNVSLDKLVVTAAGELRFTDFKSVATARGGLTEAVTAIRNLGESASKMFTSPSGLGFAVSSGIAQAAANSLSKPSCTDYRRRNPANAA